MPNASLPFSESLVGTVRVYLGRRNLRWFRLLRHRHGEIPLAVRLNPQRKTAPAHVLHLREGMQIRNFLREQPECATWTYYNLSDTWRAIVSAAIDQEFNSSPRKELMPEDLQDAAASGVNQLLDDMQREQRKNAELERRLAAALEGKVEDPQLYESGAIWTNSMISARTGEPVVELRWGLQHAQMSVEAAQSLAQDILQVAAAAVADKFLFSFFSGAPHAGGVGVKHEQAAQMLVAFRRWREMQVVKEERDRLETILCRGAEDG